MIGVAVAACWGALATVSPVDYALLLAVARVDK